MGYEKCLGILLGTRCFWVPEIPGVLARVSLELAPELRPERLFRGRWRPVDPDELIELLEKHFPEELVMCEGGARMLPRGKAGVLALQLQPVQIGRTVYRIVRDGQESPQ